MRGAEQFQFRLAAFLAILCAFIANYESSQHALFLTLSNRKCTVYTILKSCAIHYYPERWCGRWGHFLSSHISWGGCIREVGGATSGLIGFDTEVLFWLPNILCRQNQTRTRLIDNDDDKKKNYNSCQKKTHIDLKLTTGHKSICNYIESIKM